MAAGRVQTLRARWGAGPATVERDRTSDGWGCSDAIGPGSFSLDHLVFGPGSSSLDHLDVSFEWDALDPFVDWQFAVFEHFLCTNAVRAAKPHTDAARTAVPKPGATTAVPMPPLHPAPAFSSETAPEPPQMLQAPPRQAPPWKQMSPSSEAQ